ncbi:N-acetylmuramoyl-L-alanine amidase [Streptomyces acidiscabies]|uniref:N-acetylmuramoyl-L-alanine amidase n=1 Tax=Streptomyces acidiscabies TaxID=42234 RepID=A0AAP6EEE2_9ACTN|nr:N-acetylmuramoyl-L-alanine amidase [Streptomyces acidiscabies]MDX2959106.1 N-acetylmuramoyl-L-alanine amidase [Streptomyces acidiscabies]MDX3023954.1 N-acetylmuramoyl-L-alanine amidase [Streptomyces acidiscabies]MDX3788225.1 N-acetylmuramoyl-L-alanine amidase [Streptomyces acidiscabies]GAQ57708.1 N-acetylmuramoyl-L-alanine amidase LytC [Streptomyces acidiscabies]GAV41216.1 N-acetylmuramoyl-L-alanine amidase LytC [Streptomyces acidiscabies]
MSNTERSPFRRPLVVVPAVLVPVVAAGWFVYSGTGGGGTTTATAAPMSATPAIPMPDMKSPAKPLSGRTIVIDPGHNPTNYRHASEINRPVDIGTNKKECDTTGTSTNSGYAEAQFTLDVAHRMRTLLESEGAKVKLTQDADRPFGPCVDERARIGNAAKADAVVSVHADGSGTGNRGFHVILPGAVHEGGADTRPIVAPSKRLGELVANSFRRTTGSAPSNYVGSGTGLVTRTDLGGLNLSTVPKVFIECGNMRDPKDAALLTSGAWRQKAAQGISEGIVSFLHG